VKKDITKEQKHKARAYQKAVASKAVMERRLDHPLLIQRSCGGAHYYWHIVEEGIKIDPLAMGSRAASFSRSLDLLLLSFSHCYCQFGLLFDPTTRAF